MQPYIDKLSSIIIDLKELELYFMGWAWNHQWCPSLPCNLNNTKDHFDSGNYNLVKCEAHFSQLLQIFKVYHYENEEAAKEYSVKITALQKMPV